MGLESMTMHINIHGIWTREWKYPVNRDSDNRCSTELSKLQHGSWSNANSYMASKSYVVFDIALTQSCGHGSSRDFSFLLLYNYSACSLNHSDSLREIVFSFVTIPILRVDCSINFNHTLCLSPTRRVTLLGFFVNSHKVSAFKIPF